MVFADDSRSAEVRKGNLQQELSKLLDIVGHHPESRRSITRDKHGHYRVYGVAAASWGRMITLLPGHIVDEAAKGNPRMYFYISGTEIGPPGFAIMQQPNTGIIDALRYTADASRLWDFSYTSDYELKADSLQGSQFLNDREDEMTKLYNQLPELQTGMQAVSSKLCTQNPTNPYERQKLWRQVADLERTYHKDATEAGQHSTDAECHWMLSLLEDDAIKNTIDSKFPEELRRKHPLVLLMNLSTAPCDQCCCMIISQHDALEKRFKCQVHIVISAIMDYSGKKCRGLAELSQNVDWLDFQPRWQSISQALLS